MLLVNLVGKWNVLIIPAIITGLIAANKQNRDPTRIKGIEDLVRTASVLYSQLPSYESALTALYLN